MRCWPDHQKLHLKIRPINIQAWWYLLNPPTIIGSITSEPTTIGSITSEPTIIGSITSEPKKNHGSITSRTTNKNKVQQHHEPKQNKNMVL